MPTTTTYKIVRSTGFYPQLNTLLIALQGVAVATELRATGSVSHQPGDYLTIEAKHSAKEVRLPLVGPVEAALANRKPDEIHLTVVHGKTTVRHPHSTSGFKDFVDAIFLPFLVNYHETHIDDVKAQHTQTRTAWPNAWQMSWALRNAASHGGKVFEKSTQKPVSWEGLTFSPSDEPAKKITSLINGADIFLLLLQLEETRTGVQLARA